MAKWYQNGPDTIDLGGLEGLTKTMQDVLSGLAATLQVVSASLDVISFLLFEQPNVLEAIVSAAVTAVEQAILDILENNTAFALHLNTKWNADWKYQRKPGDDARRISDFVNDGEIPLVGTGTTGWLLDLAASTADPTDPFRPITDAGTAVQGVIFLRGVPADGDLTQLNTALEVFFDFSHFSEHLNIKASLESAGEADRDLLRMGPAALDTVWKAVTKPDDLVLGTLVASGDEGSNEVDSDFFYDSVTFVGLGSVPLSLIQVGDALKFNNSPVYYQVLEKVVVVGQPGLRVEPPIARDNQLGGQVWEIRRGGINGLLAALPPEFLDFRPVPGAYPKWISVPLATALPGLGKLFGGMRKLVNLLKVGNSHLSALHELAALLREKAELLEQIVAELSELLDLVEALVAFFEQSYVLVLSTDSGGMTEFINSAIRAENLPDFGTRGVVIGITLITTAPEPSNHLENFLSTIGLQLSGFTDELTVREVGLEQTWEDEFP